MPEAPRVRHAARVLLLDPADRLLLFRVEDVEGSRIGRLTVTFEERRERRERQRQLDEPGGAELDEL